MSDRDAFEAWWSTLNVPPYYPGIEKCVARNAWIARATVQAAQPEPMSAPTAEPVADALNTLCKMLHSGEEVEGDDGLAMLVPMDLWNEAQEAIELLVGEDGATPPSAATPEPSDAEPTEAQIDAYCEAWGAAFEAEEPEAFGVTVEPLSASLRRCIVAGLRAAIRATKGGKL